MIFELLSDYSSVILLVLGIACLVLWNFSETRKVRVGEPGGISLIFALDISFDISRRTAPRFLLFHTGTGYVLLVVSRTLSGMGVL